MSSGQGGAAATTPGVGPSTANAGTGLSNQNLNQIVTDYLIKRGYNRTELVFREESKHIGPDGRPIQDDADVFAPKKYGKAFFLLKDWVDNNLEIYKFELGKLLWPFFVYSWMEMLEKNFRDEAKAYLQVVKPLFEKYHTDDIQTFSTITLPEHVRENAIAQLYRSQKYRIPLNQFVNGDLFHFLERESDQGGAVIRHILQTFCQIDVIARGPIEPYSFEAIYQRSQGKDLEDVDVQEGIPGVNIGISNKDILDAAGPLKLGSLPMEELLREDVRAELEEEDQSHPPPEGKSTLVEEFDRQIKREESSEGPSQADLPLPPSRARDVIMEMQKVRENRDRFKIEGRTGGIGPGVSCCMFTLHNTLGSVSCMDFSKDQRLFAVGTMDSYIRVWTVDGKPIPSRLPEDKDTKINNRKLIGHSGPVYCVSFSDAITAPKRNPFEEGKDGQPFSDTGPKLLLSCAGDGHIRLWSLDTWSCLCIYKGHSGAVFRVLWGPHGHYFLSGGWDKTARVWMQDHASAVRLMVGHDTSISAIAWHPNGTYVFSASDTTDKSVRMWSVVTGDCVRVFTGHTNHITALECAPNGKILASADDAGNIIFWDLAKGTRIKRARGHGKGGIWSLSFSVESAVLASGGQDGTLRIWDVELPADGQKAAQQQAIQPGQEAGDSIVAATGQADPSRITSAPAGQAPTAGPSGVPGKKKGKEVMITPDQISAFPTKKTPILKVQFTRMNLVVAGGCFDPER